jgi:hypothetical protein
MVPWQRVCGQGRAAAGLRHSRAPSNCMVPAKPPRVILPRRLGRFRDDHPDEVVAAKTRKGRPPGHYVPQRRCEGAGSARPEIPQLNKGEPRRVPGYWRSRSALSSTSFSRSILIQASLPSVPSPKNDPQHDFRDFLKDSGNRPVSIDEARRDRPKEDTKDDARVCAKVSGVGEAGWPAFWAPWLGKGALADLVPETSGSLEEVELDPPCPNLWEVGS